MNAWPIGGFDGWQAFADALNARMSLLQVHVESDWRYALCTACGWELELYGVHLGTFRYDVASHICPVAPVPSTVLVPACSDEVLF